MRFGIGFDVHAFSPDRKLILGGVEIPFEKGLEGHSDADVLLHAIIDALLGSLALGDIGRHFPDTDLQYKGIASTVLLEKTCDLIWKEGFEINNIDCVVSTQRPKISKFIPQMRDKIAGICWCDASRISIKATTTEKLGFVGREEGVAVMAIASVREGKRK